ncbi:uncharacterized protein [Porites lutea]|uniref:uncharacterized protein n=1 Tax=Porites lutea TaxID=51062 RepID=UPI003CC54C53
MKGVTRGIILVLLAVFAVIKAETLAEESVAPHENTLIGINNAEVVAENPVEDDREDERIPTQEDKETDEENWETQQDQFNEEAAGEENADSDEENNLPTGIS